MDVIAPMPDTAVTTWSLEMTYPEQLNSKPLPDNIDFQVRESREINHHINRFFYSWVGGPFQWTDKLSWSDSQWQSYAEDDNLRLWIGYLNGTPAGYFELQKQGDDVEIFYFGLAEGFLDKGIGGHFLSEAISQAWNWDAKRVWVHTCSLDHPYALKNYQARGFRVYKEETD